MRMPSILRRIFDRQSQSCSQQFALLLLGIDAMAISLAAFIIWFALGPTAQPGPKCSSHCCLGNAVLACSAKGGRSLHGFRRTEAKTTFLWSQERIEAEDNIAS